MMAKAVSAKAGKQRLGVGSIIGEVFGLFFRRFPVFLLVCVAGSLVHFGLEKLLDMLRLSGSSRNATRGVDGLILGFERFTDLIFAGVLDGLPWLILSFLVFCLQMLVLVQVAHNAKLGRRVGWREILRSVVNSLLPALVLSMLVYALAIGLVLLVFWLFGALMPLLTRTPIVVLLVPLFGPVAIALFLTGLGSFAPMLNVMTNERAGFRAFGRSLALTSGYRLSIAGLMFLLLLLLAIVAIIFSALVSLGSAPLVRGGSIANLHIPWIIIGISAVRSVFVTSMISITAALIYFRLCEIKEGGNLETISQVFE